MDFNSSDWLAIADGMSHSQYLKLERVLGEEYANRFVSAEHLITSRGVEYLHPPNERILEIR